jgi:cation diffusion facilitator family transporter
MSAVHSSSPPQEKGNVALTSVAAGFGLTLFKIIIAITTGSLAILAEAAHSGLDLVSAITTLLAVRFSGKPADQTHHFGHGKIENFSALVEMILLFITCAWILNEAIQRLLFRPVTVDASIWAFVVMGVSIVVDFSRSRALAATAKKYNSQALEADALNYRNDMFSSMVTIAGLLLVRLSQLFPALSFLHRADSIAAIGLAIIIIYVGSRLGWRAIGGLLDRAPDVPTEQIARAVEALPGVIDCHGVRLRESGPDFFIDVHVTMDGQMPLEQVHALMDRVEKTIQTIVPGADVDVHPEPASEAQSIHQ